LRTERQIAQIEAFLRPGVPLSYSDTTKEFQQTLKLPERLVQEACGAGLQFAQLMFASSYPTLNSINMAFLTQQGEFNHLAVER
jgi:hypothetical protein